MTFYYPKTYELELVEDLTIFVCFWQRENRASFTRDGLIRECCEPAAPLSGRESRP